MAQGVRITIYDPDARQSRSLTIQRDSVMNSSSRVDEIARYIEEQLVKRYSGVTQLNSRRHKRR